MTTQHISGPGEGHAALARFVADPGAFEREQWGREPVLSRAADLAGDSLLSVGDVDELVSLRGLRAPFLRVAKDGRTLGDAEFTSPGGTGASIADQVNDTRLTRLFAGGATLVLQGLHRTHAPVLEAAQGLAAALGHPVQANAYVTPPQSQGFAAHYDVHDVFVLQTHGTKLWRVHAPVHELPLRHDEWGGRAAAVAEQARQAPLLEVELQEGDCLYLPRGYLHSARALGGVSVHLTLGLHAWTHDHLAGWLLEAARARAGEQVDLRASLPLGAGHASAQPEGAASPEQLTEAVELARRALIEALEQVPAPAVLERLVAAHRGSQRPAPVGPLAQQALAQALQAGEPRPVRLRAHLEPALVEAGEGERSDDGAAAEGALTTRLGRVALAAGERAVVQALLAGEQVAGGGADAALLARLARLGLVVPA